MPNSTLVDLVKIYVSNAGTATLKLGMPVAAFRGVAALTDGSIYSYSIQQGENYEVGHGYYSQFGHTLTRAVLISSNGNAPVSLAPNAIVTFTALASDLQPAPGPGVAPGGTDGQILQKIGATDYTTDWATRDFGLFPGRVTNPADSAFPGVGIENYATGQRGLEAHHYDRALGDVIHHYSNAAPAFQIDNTRDQSILVLANARNPVTSPGTTGKGPFISFIGYNNFTNPNDPAAIRRNLGYIGPDLTFATEYPTEARWKFGNGLSTYTGPADPNRALDITAYNAGYALVVTAQGDVSSGSVASGPLFATTGNATGLTIDKQGAGNGAGVSIINAGTGPTLTGTNGVTTWQFNAAGHLGIGLDAGRFGFAVQVPSRNVGYLSSSGANDAIVTVNSANLQSSLFSFDNNDVVKFQIGKLGNDTFGLYDNVNARFVFNTTSDGSLVYLAAGAGQVAFAAAAGMGYVVGINGTFGFRPGPAVNPVTSGDVVFELTSNFALTIKAKGSDGIIRSAVIALV